MTVNSQGWAIELVGEKIDLDDLRQLLPPPFDPWVEDLESQGETKLVLRSANWSALNEAVDINNDARRIIERINGEAVLIHSDARPVSLGAVRRFGPDGKLEPILFAATGFVNITLGRVRGRATVATGNGPQVVTESKLQKWFKEAETDDVRADLFTHLQRADNWFDLFKCTELASRLAGDNHKLKALLGTDAKAWDRVCQTANRYRHAPNPAKYPLPVPTPSLEEARELILKTIPRFL